MDISGEKYVFRWYSCLCVFAKLNSKILHTVTHKMYFVSSISQHEANSAHADIGL